VGRIQKLGMRVKGLFIMGLPGETPESFRKTSDFVLDLDLDEMNMTKFTPFHGAPMWHEIIANNGKDGNFHEDWRLMNCLNFVYIPEGFQSREQMEDLYNWHILRFYKSKLYISALLPIGLGFVIGILSAILGVGGGFVLVPAMIYLLGMPTTVVIGTSNFQILFVAANVTFLQAASNGTVDIVLALLLIVGGVVGAPIGSRIAARLPGVVLRGLMAVLVLAVAAELLTELLRTPTSQYSISGRETPL